MAMGVGRYIYVVGGLMLAYTTPRSPHWEASSLSALLFDPLAAV